MGFKKTLTAALLPPQPSPSFRHIHALGERTSLLPDQLSSLMLLSLCPCPSFSVSLETLYTFFKTQHKCISLKRSQSYLRQICLSPLPVHGREPYMPVFVCLQHSVEYRRHLSLLLTWE